MDPVNSPVPRTLSHGEKGEEMFYSTDAMYV